MTEIVRFKNDLNKVCFGDLTELEQNLLFNIFSKVKNKGDFSQSFSAYELSCFSGKNLNNGELFKVFTSLKKKLLKIDFTIIRENTDFYSEYSCNLFKFFGIKCQKISTKEHKESLKFLSLEVGVNDEFTWLLNDFKANFTQFELKEFLSIGSKYSKTLYRLLKQYRNTGYALFNDWAKFCELMSIPSNLKMCDIDKRVLKPAIKELSECTLFDENRVIFEKLYYKKIKGRGRGRGGSVVGIEFYFIPQKDIELYNDLEKNDQIAFDNRPKWFKDFHELCEKQTIFKYDDRVFQCQNFFEIDGIYRLFAVNGAIKNGLFVCDTSENSLLLDMDDLRQIKIWFDYIKKHTLKKIKTSQSDILNF